MGIGLRIVVSLSAAAGVIAQPVFETGRARVWLTELRIRAAEARQAAVEKKADAKKDAGRRRSAGSATGGPMAMLSPDGGAGKAGGGVPKSLDVHCSAAVGVEFAHAAERAMVVVGIDGDFGRLHRPTHFAQAPPRA